MSSNKRGETRQLGWMIIISSITQFVAIFKSTITAANFGACVELDAYNFANSLATFFLTFISSGITTVVIPAYIGKKDKKAINTFISVIFSVVGAVLVLMFLFRGLIVDLLTNRENVFNEYVCNLLLVVILVQLLPAILGVTTAFFQTEEKFNIPKIVLMFSNLMVAAVLLVMRSFTINQYVLILLLGAAVQFVIDVLIAIKCGFRYRICWDIKNKQYIELRNIFLPTVFSSGIYKINTMIDSLLSSNLGTGQLTMLSYSNVMVGMINNMFIGNLSTFAYPKIVAATNKSDGEGQKILWKYSVAFHCILCLVVSGFIVVGKEFIAMIYEHGKFSSETTMVVYVCMCIYIFGQQNNIVRDLIYRYFYAKGNTKETTINSFITSFVNAAVSIILAKFIGLYGLVSGTVIAGFWSLVTIMIRLHNNYGFVIDMRPIVKSLLSNFTALGGAVFLGLLVRSRLGTMHVFLVFGICGVVDLLTFFIISYITKGPVLDAISLIKKH